jgi:hypothetical protein
MIRNSATTLTFNLPILDLGTICLSVGRRSSDEGIGQYGFFFKMLSAEPSNSGEYLKVFTFGVVILRDGIRIRVGAIKRRQILVKA